MNENREISDYDFTMPAPIRLPHDPHGRYWLELSGANPNEVERLRPALVTFLAFDKDRSIKPETTVGTGFIAGVSTAGDFCLVLTAQHVLDGVHSLQTPRQRHVPSSPFVPATLTQPTLDPDRLKVMWMGSNATKLMNGAFATYNSSTDVACCIIVPQKNDPFPFLAPSIPLDTGVPAVGEIVHVVSIDEMNAAELNEPEDRTGYGQAIRVSRRISIRRGTVTGVYPNGFERYKWPCFTTTIPVTGGMSGGFAYIPRDGEPISACGIVSADLEPHETKTDQTVCGISVIACTWPALALRLPEYIPASAQTSTQSLLEMAKLGDILMPIGGVDQFRLETLENGEESFVCYS